mmetsp:Transcript_17061/g.33291  ORF Transcript_17061/g.33291 Transcript_17061/m.33291 type:complete len:227 (+) Transcript_17061:1032-1712(+)
MANPVGGHVLAVLHLREALVDLVRVQKRALLEDDRSFSVERYLGAVKARGRTHSASGVERHLPNHLRVRFRRRWWRNHVGNHGRWSTGVGLHVRLTIDLDAKEDLTADLLDVLLRMYAPPAALGRSFLPKVIDLHCSLTNNGITECLLGPHLDLHDLRRIAFKVQLERLVPLGLQASMRMHLGHQLPPAQLDDQVWTLGPNEGLIRELAPAKNLDSDSPGDNAVAT